MNPDAAESLAAPLEVTPEAPPQVMAAEKQGPRKWLMFLLKLAVSAGLIVWIVRGANLAAVWESLRGVDGRPLAVAGVLLIIGPWLTALRWRGLLAAQGVRVSQWQAFNSTFSSGFFRQFLPSIIGGDALRGYDAWRWGASRGVAVTSLIVDRLCGLITLAFFALGALAFSPQVAEKIPAAWLWVVLAGVAMAGMTWALTAKRIAGGALVNRLGSKLPAKLWRPFDKILRALRVYRGHGRTLAAAMLWSVLLQVNVVTFYWLLGSALGFHIEYHHYYVIVPIATFVMMAPSINGIGIREGVFAFLLAAFGVGQNEALAFAWLEYGMILVAGLCGGVLYALRR